MDTEARLVTLAVNTRNGELGLTLRDTPIGRQIVQDILEGRTYPLVKGLQNVRTIVDVGANVGAASLFFAENYPAASVFAFEPCPDTHRLLSQNLSPHSRVRVFATGLFDRDCTAPLYLGAVDSVSSSVAISSHNTNETVPVTLRAAAPALAEVGVEQIDILKLDTEGCEIPILRSLKDLIPHLRVLYVEYHAEEDRLALDVLLKGTHLLYAGRVIHPHRGELCYVAYDSFPAANDFNALRIHGAPASAPGPS